MNKGDRIYLVWTETGYYEDYLKRLQYLSGSQQEAALAYDNLVQETSSQVKSESKMYIEGTIHSLIEWRLEATEKDSPPIQLKKWSLNEWIKSLLPDERSDPPDTVEYLERLRAAPVPYGEGQYMSDGPPLTYGDVIGYDIDRRISVIKLTIARYPNLSKVYTEAETKPTEDE